MPGTIITTIPVSISTAVTTQVITLSARQDYLYECIALARYFSVLLANADEKDEKASNILEGIKKANIAPRTLIGELMKELVIMGPRSKTNEELIKELNEQKQKESELKDQIPCCIRFFRCLTNQAKIKLAELHENVTTNLQHLTKNYEDFTSAADKLKALKTSLAEQFPSIKEFITHMEKAENRTAVLRRVKRRTGEIMKSDSCKSFFNAFYTKKRSSENLVALLQSIRKLDKADDVEGAEAARPASLFASLNVPSLDSIEGEGRRGGFTFRRMLEDSAEDLAAILALDHPAEPSIDDTLVAQLNQPLGIMQAPS